MNRERQSEAEVGSTAKAVLFGVMTDIGGTFLVSVVIGTLYGIILVAQGLSEQEVNQTLKSIGPWSAVGVLFSLCGLAMSVLGGYVCARTANRMSYTPLGLVSAVSVAYGTYNSAGSGPWQTALALNLVSVLATFIGGWYYLRRFTSQPNT